MKDQLTEDILSRISQIFEEIKVIRQDIADTKTEVVLIKNIISSHITSSPHITSEERSLISDIKKNDASWIKSSNVSHTL